MFAGKLDKQVVLESFTTTTNDFGEQVESWSTLATVWAQVIPQMGKEIYDAAQVNAIDLLIFRIRYRTDLNRKHRIQYNGQTYDIETIVEIGRNEGLEILGRALAE